MTKTEILEWLYWAIHDLRRPHQQKQLVRADCADQLELIADHIEEAPVCLPFYRKHEIKWAEW